MRLAVAQIITGADLAANLELIRLLAQRPDGSEATPTFDPLDAGSMESADRDGMRAEVSAWREFEQGRHDEAIAFFSAAACCVLPLMLGWLGIGASGLALVVPYHRSLTIAAFFAEPVMGAGGVIVAMRSSRR